MADSKDTESVRDMISFIEASPTAAHAASETARRLDNAGFRRLDEKDKWDISPFDSFYVIRNHSSIIACRVGSAPFEEAGFRIIGAHTDFPGLRLKPNGIYTKNGYIQLGVEVYGGPILHTWTDRDLGMAGKLAVRTDSSYEIRLFEFKAPVCRIPNLAPHIKPEKSDELKLNKQDHMPPVIGIGDDEALEEKPLLRLIASVAEVEPDDVLSYWIEVFDIQPGAIGGMNDEFVFVRSFDNLSACHAGIEALISARKEMPFTQIVALFDNEEVGSNTMQGAGSRFMDNIMERLCFRADNPREAYFRSLANSIFVSTDGAHAVNPNYPEAHEPRHHPILNGGPVVKVNANERYTTQVDAMAHLARCANNAEGGVVPLQRFVARTDVGTGSTIGPMTACRLGLKSIDIGSPMISMHSVREMAGTKDQLSMIRLMREHLSII